MHTPQTAPIQPQQLRGARAMLGWSRKHLAHAAGVSASVIARLERTGRAVANLPELVLLRGVLEGAGIEFLDDAGIGSGIRLRSSQSPAVEAEEASRPSRNRQHAFDLPDATLIAPTVAAAWCRGARHLLGWTTERLAATAGVSASAVRQIERATRTTASPQSVTRVLAVVQEAGVELSESDGVAWVSLRVAASNAEASKMAALCDAGVAMLGWSADRLMKEAKQHGADVRRRQMNARARRDPHEVAAIRAAVEAAGVEFSAEGGMGVGVWLDEAKGPKRNL